MYLNSILIVQDQAQCQEFLAQGWVQDSGQDQEWEWDQDSEQAQEWEWDQEWLQVWLQVWEWVKAQECSQVWVDNFHDKGRVSALVFLLKSVKFAKITANLNETEVLGIFEKCDNYRL
jgi:hypothetical protein